MKVRGKDICRNARILAWLGLVVVMALMVAPPAMAAGPVHSPPTAGGITFEEVEDMLVGLARGAAGIGILLFAVSLIIPGDALSIFGFQIPQNYLMRVAVAALLISGVSVIVTTLFG